MLPTGTPIAVRQDPTRISGRVLSFCRAASRIEHGFHEAEHPTLIRGRSFSMRCLRDKGQDLFYMVEMNLQQKMLAVVEEEAPSAPVMR